MARAVKDVPSLAAKRVSPHTIRHTTPVFPPSDPAAIVALGSSGEFDPIDSHTEWVEVFGDTAAEFKSYVYVRIHDL